METNEQAPTLKENTPPAVPDIEVTEAQKETFFKAFLADEPYKETFKLLDGKFSVTFKTLTVDENNDLLRQMSLDQAVGLQQNGGYYLSRVVYYRLALSITAINGEPFMEDINKETVPEDKEKGTSYVSERVEQLRQKGMVRMAIIQGEFNKFEQRVVKLTDLITNSDF